MSARSASDRWIVRPKPQPSAGPRLFCLPYAGGGASAFRGWPDQLSENVEVCLVRPPGRESRLAEAPFVRMEPLVEALIEAIAAMLDRPYALFGHSLGGLVAFETAHGLIEQGHHAPSHLLVSSCRAPQIPARADPLHSLPEPEFRRRLRALNGTPAEILDNAELMEMFGPLLRADFAVAETYRYQHRSPLPCPITAFGGKHDPRVTPNDLAAWAVQTTAGFAAKLFPGDHFYLHAGRDRLLDAIASALGEQQARHDHERN